MAELPSGTVTFLFTDVEGSTRLWEDHPDVMHDVLARHDEIVRGAIESHGGRVVKSTGDGFHAAFGTAYEGVAAAAQVGLGSESWPAGLELRVRMGVHAGEATERDGDWFGSEVNRAARVMAVAHGGQVVCTGVVGEQVRGRFAVLDLGEHRLRDLQSEVHLFQVEVPGVGGVFPPLRSLDVYRSNLPFESSSFVGRVEELAVLADRMRSGRLVTLTGVGGVGKTRLAVQVASELLPYYADGVWMCEFGAGPGAGRAAGRGRGGGGLRPTAGRVGDRRAASVLGTQGSAAHSRQL
jgi:class 3 adenylate cyclase